MAVIAAYDIGDKIRIGCHTGTNLDGTVRDPFRDELGVATDPTAVTLKLRKLPDSTALVYGWPAPGANGVLIKESTGRFYVDYIAVDGDDGRWGWKIFGTGVIVTADEGEFRVVPSSV